MHTQTRKGIMRSMCTGTATCSKSVREVLHCVKTMEHSYRLTQPNTSLIQVYVHVLACQHDKETYMCSGTHRKKSGGGYKNASIKGNHSSLPYQKFQLTPTGYVLRMHTGQHLFWKVDPPDPRNRKSNWCGLTGHHNTPMPIRNVLDNSWHCT